VSQCHAKLSQTTNSSEPCHRGIMHSSLCVNLQCPLALQNGFLGFLTSSLSSSWKTHNSSIIILPLKFQASNNKKLNIARSKMGNQQSSQGYPDRVEGWYPANTRRRDRENLPQSPYPPAKRISSSGRTPLRERNLGQVPDGQFSLERDEWARARLENGRVRR
jgi:hypothetical protein